ncbi:MAG: hypothetical protein H6R15_3501 [Proteobacteria bacterium]|nr:hypothetical protein [Pseudomonadota bacterium]
MKHIARKKIVSSISLALLALASNAQAAAPSTEELLKQLQTLRATVDALQKQVQEQSESLAKTREAIPEGAEVATSADIDGLRSALEDYKYDSARNREYSTALTTRGLTIGGTLTGSYTSSTSPSVASSNRPQGTPAENSFGVGASLSFAGNLYRDYNDGRNLDYKLGLAFSAPKFSNSAASTNSPAQGDSVVRLTDVYLQYSLFKTNGGLENEKLTVAFGQQKIPFGLEAQVSDELKPTVATAQFLGTSALNNIGQRQIGLIFRGDIEPTVDYGFNYRAPLVEYAFGIVNGNGANTSDNNSRKDYLGRLTFTLPVDYNSLFRELKIGASYYAGSKNLNSTTSPWPVLADTARSNRTGFDISYNHNPFGLTYERAEGSDDALLTPGTTTDPTTKRISSRGQVLTAFFNFGDIAQWSKNLNRVGKFDDFWPSTSQVYYRYDHWDPDTHIAKNEILKQTIGYNLFFAQTTKFQIGLTHTSYPNQNKSAIDDLTALFQYGF